MLPSFLLSSLVTKFPRDASGAFVRSHPGPWVVWEPGKWAPVGPGQLANRTLELTRSPKPRRAANSAALAIHLQLVRNQAALTLGRDPAAELYLNDATLSRAHLRLTRPASSWLIEELGSRNGTLLNGVPLLPNVPRALPEGAEIDAGDVLLTFSSSAALFARLHTAE